MNTAEQEAKARSRDQVLMNMLESRIMRHKSQIMSSQLSIANLEAQKAEIREKWETVPEDVCS